MEKNHLEVDAGRRNRGVFWSRDSILVLAVVGMICLAAAGCPSTTAFVKVEMVSLEPASTVGGVKLQIVKRTTIAYIEVIERAPNVKSCTRVTQFEDPTIRIEAPTLSPVGDEVLYALFTEEDGGWSSNLFKTTVGAVAKTSVTFGKSKDFDPAFDPEGKYIYFASNRAGGQSRLWRISATGSGGITKLTSSPAEDYRPCMAKGCNRVVYCSNVPKAVKPQIWAVELDGSLPTELREGMQPNLSPDGKKILFVRVDDVSEMRQIWVMNVDGSGETQLTSNTNHDEQEPAWSPDGKWIAFSSDEGTDSMKRHNPDIWIMKPDGTNKTQLTTNGSWDLSPCWDRTGKFIYFISNRGGCWNVWRFEPDLERAETQKETPKETPKEMSKVTPAANH